MTHSKDLQNETPDGTLVALIECRMKETQSVCLRQPLGNRWKFVKKKNEVEPSVSSRDQTETEAVIMLWEEGWHSAIENAKSWLVTPQPLMKTT